MSDERPSEGGALLDLVLGMVGIALFFGCVLGYANFFERPDPSPLESPRPTAPATSPAADGGAASGHGLAGLC